MKRTRLERACIGLAVLFTAIPAGTAIVAFVLMVIGDKYGRWGNVEGLPALFAFVMLIALPPTLVTLGMLKRYWIAYLIAGVVIPTLFTATFENIPVLSLGGAAGRSEQNVVVVIGLVMIAFYWWVAFKVKTIRSLKKS